MFRPLFCSAVGGKVEEFSNYILYGGRMRRKTHVYYKDI